MAAALALPHQTDSGFPFPYRNLILLVTFSVILVTLLLQGLTLRSLICLVRLPEDRSSEEEQLKARIHAAERVLERLSELESQSAAPQVVVVRVRGYYEDRLTEMKARLEAETGTAPPPEPAGFRTAPVRPAATYYNEAFGGFYLDYDVIRTTADPEGTLLDFCQTTYEAAANNGTWDRGALERRS